MILRNNEKSSKKKTRKLAKNIHQKVRYIKIIEKKINDYVIFVTYSDRTFSQNNHVLLFNLKSKYFYLDNARYEDTSYRMSMLLYFC